MARNKWLWGVIALGLLISGYQAVCFTILIVMLVRALNASADDFAHISNENSFDAYRLQFPDLVKDGRVKCMKCLGTSIWMKYIGTSASGVIYAHTCRTCGSELYYSKN
jgi:hypothetical protein